MMTRFRFPCPPARRGFTLIELLVTISIVAILAGISLPAIQRSMISTRRVKGISNLRQAGTAVILYANEHDSTLPGPCALGVIPTYNTQAQNQNSGALAAFVAPYAGLPEATATLRVVPILISPGMAAWNPASAKADTRIPHYIQSDVLRGTAINTAGTTVSGTIRPFGSKDSGGNDVPPVKLARLGDFTIGTNTTLAQQPQVWLLSDVDQQTTDVPARTSGWFSMLPTKPVYVTSRLRIYADGHAGAASLTEP